VIWFLILLLSVFSSCLSPAFAGAAGTETVQGFVEVEPGRSLYIDWKKAAPGAPTVVFLHGLTYSIDSWDQLVQAAAPYNYGILRYDPTGMGKTLTAVGPVKNVIRVEDQARELDLLTKKLGLTGKLNLVGLSYGGGLAIAFARDYSHRIANAILMAPYTEAVKSQDQSIRLQIAATRLTFPLNPATDEELYAFFLRQTVYYVFPLTEPSMMESPLKPEAVFQLTQGIRQFDAYKASKKFPAGSVHLVIAGNDQYIERDVLEKFWAQVPVTSRASKMIVLGSEHKIPESRPDFAAGWINAIVQNSKGVGKGQSYTGDPRTGLIELSPK
jgi:pimeloyl-ACP methyl ester carboxylesterase